VREAIEQLYPLWDELFPAEQARIVGLLIERVDVQEDAVEIRFRVDGLRSLVEDFNSGREAA
jgi:site-specific DNA recombinase